VLVDDPAIDVVDVTVRPTIRMPIVFAALERGRHLLQPMPFALDIDQGRRLRDLAQTSGRVATIESLHRHAPAFRQMKALVDAGAIGTVHSVRGHVRTGILFAPPPDYVYRWITEAGSGASALRNVGAHLLHTLSWMFGPIAAVAGRLATNMPELQFTDGGRSRNETADSAAVLMRLASGADAVIDISWCTPGSEGFALDAVGDGGRLLITADGLGPQIAILRRADAPAGRLEPVAIDARFERCDTAPVTVRDIDDPRLFALTAMCDRLSSAVRGAPGAGAGAAPSFDEGFDIMRVVEAVYRSHDEWRWVEVAEIPA